LNVWTSAIITHRKETYLRRHKNHFEKKHQIWLLSWVTAKNWKWNYY
jgi:hypothetical protein